MQGKNARRSWLGIVVVLGLAGLLPGTALAQSVAVGQAKYQSFCVSCHGLPPSGGPERANGDPNVIVAAINGRVPAMAFLRTVVTRQDIDDIAAWLRSLTGGGGGGDTPAPIVPNDDYTDLWWNPSESGWGLNLIQHASHQVFGVVYTYDVTGKPMWLVIPGGAWTAPAIFTATIYKVTGPPPTGPFDPARVNVRSVGTATLAFTDRNNGTFSYSVDGVAASKGITRQPF